MSHKHTITRDAMLFLPAKMIEGILIIACSSLYTHIFTENTVGLFNFVNFNVQITYLILAGWMANATVRYVGEAYHTDSGKGLFSTVLAVYGILLAIVSIVCIGAFFVTKEWIYLGGIFMFASYTLFQILNSALIQLSRIRASIVLSLFSASSKLIVAYALCHQKANFPSAYPAVIAAVVADGVASLGAIASLSLLKKVRLQWFSKTLLQQFLSYGVPLMGVSISIALLNQIDKYLVVSWFGNVDYAYYSSNNSIATGIFTMLSVGIMRGVYPAVLRGWREGGRTTALPLLNHGVRLYLLLALPCVAGLSAVSNTFSTLLFKSGYQAGAPVIAFTALSMFFMGLTEYANKAYELEQSTVHVLQNSALSAVVKVASSMLCMGWFGFVGGAIGSVFAFAFYFFITCIRVKHRFLFHVPVGSWIKITISSVFCGMVAYCATRLPVSPLLGLLLATLSGAMTYALALMLSGEVHEELTAIRSRLGK